MTAAIGHESGLAGAMLTPSAVAPATARHVYVAINAVTAAMAREGLAKDRKNDQQGYRFRGIDDVYNALSGHLAANRLCMLPRVLSRLVTERATKTGGAMSYVVLDVEFDFVSAVDGSRHTIRTMGEAMDSGDKATNKAMSAAMKYACLLAFQIPTEGDNDADAHSHEVAPSPAAKRAASVAEPSLLLSFTVAINRAKAPMDLNRIAKDAAAAHRDGRMSDGELERVKSAVVARRKAFEASPKEAS